MIDVALIPSQLRPSAVAVVIDVLRATSTVTQALEAGYGAVLCADTVEHAASLSGPGRVLAGERDCVKPPGFDQGNSPREATVARGQELVLATTNGAPTIVAAARRAPTVLLASILNLEAVADELRELGRTELDVQLVCAGTAGFPALEDTYLAGRLSATLAGARTDAARIAEALASRFATPRQALDASAHAGTLAAAGLGADVAHCALESQLAIVPRVLSASERVAVVGPGDARPRSVEPSMQPFVRSEARAAAQAILDRGGWCVLETGQDGPLRSWDAQLLIFELDAEAVAEVVWQEVCHEPGRDLRLTGCDRRTLRPSAGLGEHVCYLAEPGAPALRALG